MPSVNDRSYARLARFEQTLARVARGGLIRPLVKNLGAEGLRQVEASFAEQRDPYGRAWAPLKRRVGQILSDTGRLRRSFRVHARPTGFAITSNVAYALAHQDGATITAGPRANAHARNGRFLSHARAARSKARAVRVSFAFAHSWKLVARPFLPTGTLGPIWSKAFTQAADALVRATFAGI